MADPTGLFATTKAEAGLRASGLIEFYPNRWHYPWSLPIHGPPKPKGRTEPYPTIWKYRP